MSDFALNEATRTDLDVEQLESETVEFLKVLYNKNGRFKRFKRAKRMKLRGETGVNGKLPGGKVVRALQLRLYFGRYQDRSIFTVGRDSARGKRKYQDFYTRHNPVLSILHDIIIKKSVYATLMQQTIR